MLKVQSSQKEGTIRLLIYNVIPIKMYTFKRKEAREEFFSDVKSPSITG